MSTAPTPDRIQVLPESYSFERELRGGGMSRVFLARDQKLGRQVVIKMLTPELSAALSPDRFQREISVAARLRHPHIVPLLEAGTINDALYYTMPFIAGESLRERLRRDGPLPLDEAVRLTREVADALGYAHGEGVVHRDIKPENILLDSGHAVVTDFGIARAVRESETHALTGTGMAVGTPAYMSPEQFTNVEVDGRADIFSLGCVLFEMLTARTVVSVGPFDTEAAGPSTPPAIKDVLRKAMAQDRAERFATPAELSEALQVASGGKARVGVSGKRLAGYVGAGVVVIALAALWFFWPRGAELRPNPGFPAAPLLYANYDDVPLREVLRDLSPKVRYPMVVSKAAEKERFTGKFDGVRWDVAFQAMLKARGLDAVQDSTGIIQIRTLAEFDSIREAEPNITASRVLCWVPATAFAQMIRPGIGKGSVTVDSQTNMITITTKREFMQRLLDMIKAQDKRVPGSKPLSAYCQSR
jgi:tRNA A-37 threonylcarbamoyl transferase component Bud32